MPRWSTPSIAVVRPLEPWGEHAIFGNAVEHAVGADDGGVDRARQHEHAHQHYEAVEEQLQRQRAGQVHGDPANQVAEELWADAIGNNHRGKERYR